MSAGAACLVVAVIVGLVGVAGAVLVGGLIGAGASVGQIMGYGAPVKPPRPDASQSAQDAREDPARLWRS